MKRSPLLMVFAIVSLLLPSCGSRSSSTSGSSGAGSGSRRSFALTPGTKLALGIIKLEGTPQAVDPAAAAKLLPLWQLMLQLDTSATAAPQEITSVEDQIQATLTPAQLNAINVMKISQADMLSAFQPQGGAGGSTAASGTGSAGTGGTNRGGGGGFGGGGFGGGGFPGGGFAGAGTRTTGGTTSGTTTGSTTARSQTAPAVPGFLVNQVISLLQGKITG